MADAVDIIKAVLLLIVFGGAAYAFYRLNKQRKDDLAQIDQRFREVRLINDFLFDCLRKQLDNLHYRNYYREWNRKYEHFKFTYNTMVRGDQEIRKEDIFTRQELHFLTIGEGLS